MTSGQKNKALVFLGLCVLMTTLLAASLSQMDLQPGLPPPLLESNHAPASEAVQTDREYPFSFPFVLRLLGILVAVYISIMLFSFTMGIGWKKLLRILRNISLILGVFMLLFVLLFLMRNLPGKPAKLPLMPVNIDPLIFTRADEPPPGLTWVIGSMLVILAAILFYFWIGARRKSQQGYLLTKQAEKARQNILAGMNLGEVIMRCYQEMGAVIQRERAIERQIYTTPAEFEQELYAAGLPQAPVHELTYLFEKVRYGGSSPTPGDEREALTNLEKIISRLQEKKSKSDE